jgi:serine/threonine protein kinase
MRDENQNDHDPADTFNKLLYEFCETPLSEQEKNLLAPIYDSLGKRQTRYTNFDILAEGGEKRIFRVYDQVLNRHVAMAKPMNTESKAGQERFLREGQLTANLIHPNIVPVYNMGLETEGIAFFTMELMPGDSLGEIIKTLKSGIARYTDRYDRKALLGIDWTVLPVQRRTYKKG